MEQFIPKTQKRSIGEVSIDAKAIYEKLKTVSVDEVVTYEEISDLIGRNILKNRGILKTAREMIQREDSIVFDCVTRVGLKRLNNADLASKLSTQPFRRISSVIKGAKKQSVCIDETQLKQDEISKLNASRSIIGTIELFTKPKAIKSIQIETHEPMPFGRVLELFKSN